MNQFRMIAPSFHKPLKALAARAVALGLCLFAVAGNAHATAFIWTNTTSGLWQDTNNWSPVGLPGVSDTSTFNSAATHTVTLTSDVVTLVMDVTVASGNSQTLTLNLGGNSLSLLQSGSSSPTALFWGDAGGGTSTVFVASSSGVGKGLFVTNATALRATIGRSGQGIVFVTNGFVQVGIGGVANNVLVLGNNGGPAARGTLVISGPSTVWSNNALTSIGNNGTAFLNLLVLSNSATFYQVGNSFNVGANSTASSNSFLMDSNAKMFVSSNNAAAAIGGTGGAVGNKGTVQGVAVWDNGNKVLTLGNSTGVSNLLTIGSSGQVTNVSTLPISPGNFLTLSNGFLQVVSPGAVTNNAATITGYGTIVGNVVFTNTGTLTLGFGTSMGTLTLSNNLTLVSGSTTIMKLNKGQTPSNDVLTVSGTTTEAGTLTINNVGAALVGGDTFNLFALGAKSGDYTVTNLPALTGTLTWNSSQLGSQGIISVVLPPSIIGPSDQATNVGTTVVISTTVTGVPVPSLQWQRNGVNVSDGATGNGSTNSGSTTATLTISNAQTNDSGSYCLIASNFAASVTNCMTLTVSGGNTCPTITGPTDQFTILHSNATFSASVAGIPAPTVQWQENGVDIPNATNTSVTIPNVSFSQDGFIYSIIASNVACTTTNSAVLHVTVPPDIQTQPVSAVVTQTQPVCFSVLSTNGVPSPTYQWYFNNSLISGATGSTYCINVTAPSNMGNYHVVVANVAGSVTSTDATLTVNSTMSAVLTPATNATVVCYDTPLYMAFDRTPVERFIGKINIYDSTNSATPVDTIDTSLGLLQSRAVAADSNGPFNLYPIIVTSNTVAIYPHLDVLTSNQTYYVTVDPGTFMETNGALFAGITSTNAWVFTTKPNGPANPNNVVVAADGSGDFCTVQGALDSLPTGNTNYTLVNIRSGTYTEFVDTRNKNNVHFRGQSRSGTIVQYLNNNINNGSTHTRMTFKVFSNDISIENMTVMNTTPQGGQQAEALMIESASLRFILNNAEVDSRQDTILANGVTQSQCYFINSLVQGNFDYVWGGGNCYFTKCEFRTIPTASSYNLTAARTDFGTSSGYWPGAPNFSSTFASNGFSFVKCQLTRSSSTVSNITLAGSNGTEDGLVAFIYCNIDTSNNTGYAIPASGVLSNELVWEFGNSNLNNSAAVTFGTALPPLTNGDARLTAALDPTIWLNGWVPQLAPNILTNPVSLTVTAGVTATFSVSATGIPDPTYQWLVNGTNYVNATSTSAALVISNALASDAGVYSVLVSNNAGTVTSGGATLTVVGTGPSASFTATPTSGTEPLAVTFTDTSTGSPNITAFWDLGDATTTNTAGGASFTHAYAAGTYTVTLTASNAFGANSTIVSNNLIIVITAFQAWQIQYFGSTTNPAAAANADPDGDGQNNLAEFLAGTNPTNSASGLHITSVLPSGSDVVVTWSTAGGTTNVVQSTAGDGNGGYSTNFTDLSGLIVITGSGDTSTNYTDVGGATNSPSRYYRVRLAP
jgi:PKD repeat protein